MKTTGTDVQKVTNNGKYLWRWINNHGGDESLGVLTVHADALWKGTFHVKQAQPLCQRCLYGSVLLENRALTS